MKKTILATVVALASGSATAATMYNDAENGVTVDVHGAMEVQLFQGYEFYNQDVSGDVRLDDGELNFLTSVELDNGMTALGYFDVTYEDKEIENDELWVGIKTQTMGTFKAGRMLTLWDDTGVSKDYELGATGNDAFTSGDNVIRYDLELGNFYGGVAHSLESKVNGDDFGDAEISHTDMKAGVKLDNIDVRGFYQTSTETETGFEDYDIKAYALEAEFNKDALGLAAGFYKVEDDNGYDKDSVRTISLAASYKVETVTIATGINLIDIDSEMSYLLDGSESTNVYVTLTKQMHKNVKVYGEVGYTELDGDHIKSDDSLGYLAGMEVSF